jgi:hypothetical protein
MYFFSYMVWLVSSFCAPKIIVEPTQKGGFTKMLEVVVQNYLFLIFRIFFKNKNQDIRMPFVKLYWKNDLVHFMLSSHFILSPKAKASKGWPFFSNQGTLTRLLDFNF